MIDILVITLLVMALGFVFQKFIAKKEPKKPEPSQTEEQAKLKPTPEAKTQRKDSDSNQPSMKQLLKQEKDAKSKLHKQSKANPTHPKFFKSCKGFNEGINDFDVSSDGKFIAACSSDLTMRIFGISKDPEVDPISQTQKLGFDIPSTIGISKNGKTVALGFGEMRKVDFYEIEIEKNPNDPTKPKIKIQPQEKPRDVALKTDLTTLYLDAEKRFYLTGSNDTDTHIYAYDVNGQLLGNYNISQMRNQKVARNNNGNLFAIATKTADVPIIEVKFDRSNFFKGVQKAMILIGHKSEVYQVAFDTTDEKAITISKDSTIRLWNVNVEYELKADAKCIETFDLKTCEDLKNFSFNSICLFTNEDNANILIIGEKHNIIFFDFDQKKVVEKIENAHGEGSTINKLMIRKFEYKWYLYSGASDGRVHMWKL